MLRSILASLLLVAAGAAHAQSSVVINGTLTSTDPTFNRSLSFAQGGACNLSAVGTAVRYRTHTFTLATAANVTVSLVPADGASITPAQADSVLMLHGPAGFNPAAACTNAIAANDDAVGLLSRITTTTPLAPGTYTAVVTSFDNVPSGTGALPWTYGLFVGSTGLAPAAPAVAVPMLGVPGLLLAALLLAALGLIALRRTRGNA